MNKRSLVLLTIATLVIGLGAGWYRFKNQKHPYIGLPGTYQCEDFGLPDKDYSRLRIGNDFKLSGISKTGEFLVGQLSQKNDSAANLELTMSVIHSPSYNLDPFTTIVIEGFGNRIAVNGRASEAEFTKYCRRLY